jgi:hypothetical protein
LTGWRPATSLDTCIDLVARYFEQKAGRLEGDSMPPKSSFAVGF